MKRIVFLACLATSSFAAAGTQPPLSPTIAYVTVSGRSPELRLANEDGSAATTIYRYTNGAHFDVTSAAQHLAVVADQQRIVLVSWAWNGVTMGTTTYPVYTGPAKAYSPGFSQDGTKIAFTTDDGFMRVYDTATRQQLTQFPADFSQETVWRPDGNSIIVLSALPNWHLVEYPATGGPGTTLLSEPSIDSFDTSRIPGDSKLLVAYSRPDGQPIHIGVWDGAGYQVTGAHGGAVNWKCNQSKFAYRNGVGHDQSLYTYLFPNGPAQLVYQGNSGRNPHYLKCDSSALMMNARRTGMRIRRF